MTGPTSHPGEELQDLLDDRLEQSRREQIVAHLESCAPCQRELEALRAVRDSALRPLATEEEVVPERLVASVRSALDAIDRERITSGAAAGHRIGRRAVIRGLIGVAAVLLLFLARGRSGSLVDSVAADFAEYSSGQLQLNLVSGDPATIEAYFAREGISFETRVFDLAMMRYELTGGRVHRLRGRPSALFAYRGPDGRPVVCQMYEGLTSELPETSDTRENNGIRFHVYRSGNTTLVFWQEGDVVCVLASDADAETVIQLAFAKAEKV